MLKIMNDLPENVLGVTAEGKITGTDYETVLIPALEEKLDSHKTISLIYHLGSNFTGFDLSAMMDDAKVGMKFFGHMLSCELRIFNNVEMEDAKKWITEQKS